MSVVQFEMGHTGIAPSYEFSTPDRNIGRLAMLHKQVAVEGIVGVGKEDFGAAIAALGHMMRQTGNDDTGQTSHGARLEPSRHGIN